MVGRAKRAPKVWKTWTPRVSVTCPGCGERVTIKGTHVGRWSFEVVTPKKPPSA